MKDLLDIIGHERATNETGYCVTNGSPYYGDWERNVAIPALEALGYNHISFYNGEVDSFGPLSRVVTATKDGKRVKFMYG